MDSNSTSRNAGSGELSGSTWALTTLLLIEPERIVWTLPGWLLALDRREFYLVGALCLTLLVSMVMVVVGVRK